MSVYDVESLTSLANLITPYVSLILASKHKKEVSSIDLVTDFANLYSLPCYYWNRLTGVKRPVNVAMSDIVTSVELSANEELTKIKEMAKNSAESADRADLAALLSALSAAESAATALDLKNQTIDYLNTVKDDEATRIANENIRLANELERKNNESGRIDKENVRRTNEDVRILNENERINNENERKSLEITRLSNEALRITLELDREDTESIRNSNENTRKSLETTRLNNENTRKSNETTRLNNESNRQENEDERVSLENSRVLSETNRVEAENIRVLSETNRIEAENLREESEDIREANELNRQTKEAERQSKETVRINNENTRISNENTRKTQETNRLNKEAERQLAENTRISSEDERNTNETLRKANELVRIENENTRLSLEEARVATENIREDLETTRQNNEIIREQNEATRLNNESNRQENELERISLEDSRVLAEEDRVNTENIRILNETDRTNTENLRVEAENTREANELNRLTKESERLSEEDIRISNENTRINNENIRKQLEIDRQNTEAERQLNETTRLNNENLRQQLETSRVSLEESRVLAEAERVLAEETRVNNENTRISNENSRVLVESSRVTAESNRVTAELNRVSAEINRQNQFNTSIESANQATDRANDVASHLPYIGEDLYWYLYDETTKSYNKTTKYSKGDNFSVKATFSSIAEMEAYINPDVETANNPKLKVGDFILIVTDVELEDNAKLYVVSKVTSTKITFDYIADFSGARGFTGHTPLLSIGTVTTGAAGTSASVSLTEDGIDANGNPKYLINFTIPKGDQGIQGILGIQGIQGELGEKGDTGAAAGFGTPTASVDSNVGTPSVTITSSGDNTAKVFNFSFKNLKGEQGELGILGVQGVKGDKGDAFTYDDFTSELIATLLKPATDAATTANAAADKANTAATNADSKASLANTAALAANTAASNADEATTEAMSATADAEAATISANQAATNANNAVANLNWDNLSGKPSSFTPSAHNHTVSEISGIEDNYARLRYSNDLIVYNNEFNFASSGFSGDIYVNYRTPSGTNGNINDYQLYNGGAKLLGVLMHSGNRKNYSYFSRETNLNIDNISTVNTWNYEISSPSGTLPFSDADWLHLYNMGSGDPRYGVQLCTSYVENQSLYLRHICDNYNNDWRELLDSVNFSNYVPTLYGLGAYGNWNIKASAANTLHQGNFNEYNSSYHVIRVASGSTTSVHNSWYGAGLYFGFDIGSSLAGFEIRSSFIDNSLVFARSNGSTDYSGNITTLPYLDVMYITHSGTVGIGKSNSSYTLNVAGTICCTALTQTSDIRKKNVINDTKLLIDDIANAPLFTYTFKDSPDKAIHMGTSAQYWEGVNSGLFTTVDSEGIYGLEISNLALCSAISIAKQFKEYKEQTDAKIEDLQNQINELKELINTLK